MAVAQQVGEHSTTNLSLAAAHGLRTDLFGVTTTVLVHRDLEAL